MKGVNVMKKTEEVLYDEVYRGKVLNISINYLGHYNVLSIDMPIRCNDGKTYNPLKEYNLTNRLGKVIKNLIELFYGYIDDEINIKDMKEIPCVLLMKDQNIVGIGNFIEDKVLSIEEILKG